MAMELVGDGVKLGGEEEMVTASGERRAAASRGGNQASQAFVTSFTKKYPELAERSGVYAELRNMIDLAIAAAYIQEQDFIGKAEWKMEFFGSEKDFPIEIYDVPKTVETAVNAIGRGNTIGFPIGGGVNIAAVEALRSDHLQAAAPNSAKPSPRNWPRANGGGINRRRIHPCLRISPPARRARGGQARGCRQRGKPCRAIRRSA